MKFLGARLSVGLCLLASSALAADKVSFGTNWLAEAEHGGYYQAVADGTYAKYGLDVTIVQGGPQANNELLLGGWTARLLHGRQSFARLRRGRPERPDRRRRRGFPERPADDDVASGRRTRHVDRAAECDDGFRRQGGACHLLPVDEVGLRVQGGSRQALHVQPRTVHRRPPLNSARLCDLGAVRRRARGPFQAEHLPASPTMAMGPMRRPSKRAPIWSRIIPTSCSGSSTRPRSAGTTISTATMRRRTR